MDLFKLMFAPKQNTSTSRRAFSALSSKSRQKSTTKTRSVETPTEKAKANSESPSSLSTKSDDCAWGQSFQQNKKTLLLDLDNTLIYASKQIPEIMDYTSVVFEKGGEYIIRYVTKRPGMCKFLSKLSKRYNLCVYTAADKTYARKVVEATGVSDYICDLYDRSHCEKINEFTYLKNIWSLGFEPTQTVLIDDLTAQSKYQPENFINIKPFKGEDSDRELYALYPFLRTLNIVDDVRSAQKRFVDYKSRSSRTEILQIKASLVFEECGMDVDEGCRKDCIRAFACRPQMMRTENPLMIESIC